MVSIKRESRERDNYRKIPQEAKAEKMSESD